MKVISHLGLKYWLIGPLISILDLAHVTLWSGVAHLNGLAPLVPVMSTALLPTRSTPPAALLYGPAPSTCRGRARKLDRLSMVARGVTHEAVWRGRAHGQSIERMGGTRKVVGPAPWDPPWHVGPTVKTSKTTLKISQGLETNVIDRRGMWDTRFWGWGTKIRFQR
jgi:hypothetical protein